MALNSSPALKRDESLQRPQLRLIEPPSRRVDNGSKKGQHLRRLGIKPGQWLAVVGE